MAPAACALHAVLPGAYLQHGSYALRVHKITDRGGSRVVALRRLRGHQAMSVRPVESRRRKARACAQRAARRQCVVLRYA